MMHSSSGVWGVGAGGGLVEVCGAFLKLGLISFGGPIAHLGYFHSEFVSRRRWVEEAEYADLVALCQFLPGPASSQLAFALGMRRAGLAGAVAASVCFLLPSAVLMIALAYGVSAAAGLASAGWVHGLKLAAAAVVAQAVCGLWRRLCPDGLRRGAAIAAAAVLLAAPGVWVQVGVIGAGAVLGAWRLRDASEAAPKIVGRGRRWGLMALAAFGVLLVLPGVLARATGSREWAVLDAMYRAGSLVFGGGHVVLPLLRAEPVLRELITNDEFLAGYGAVQAAPGPLFSFAGYLGVLSDRGPWAWLAGVRCLLAIFLPGWLLVGAALPFWGRLRGWAWSRAALRGANAAVVGVLLAALYTPVATESVKGPRDAAVALVAFGLLQFWGAPPVLVVVLCAAAGGWAGG